MLWFISKPFEIYNKTFLFFFILNFPEIFQLKILLVTLFDNYLKKVLKHF